MIKLPQARHAVHLSAESIIGLRRSIREYSKESIQLQDLAQLLWAAQGITSPNGLRATPSAGALYPLEIYLSVGLSSGLAPGVYHYQPRQHALVPVRDTDQRAALASAALGQRCVAAAPVCLVIGAVYNRTAIKYGNRARRYVHLEAGHAAENILLQATALQLGTVVVGAFDDQTVQQVLAMPSDHEPLALIPVGHPLS
ncbi:MAG: SagB/ThcOx family dehydrogenase [Thermodesulfobacteriota bacterium]